MSRPDLRSMLSLADLDDGRLDPMRPRLRPNRPRTPLAEQIGSSQMYMHPASALWLRAAEQTRRDLEAYGHLAPTRIPPAALTAIVREGLR